MQFDLVKTVSSPSGDTVEYGIVWGNETIVFIKAGAGGSYLGQENKYLRMAKMLHEENGCTVICASNPSSHSFERSDASLLQDILSAKGQNAALYFIGVSNGATQGLLVATRLFPLAHVLLVNMPLMINFHKIKEALSRTDARLLFVYGERDPSASYIPFLKHAIERTSSGARHEVALIKDADHNFEGLADVFIPLGKKLFDASP